MSTRDVNGYIRLEALADELLQRNSPATQMAKCVEECLELALAVTHYKGAKVTKDAIAVEVGDVILTAMQVAKSLGLNLDEIAADTVRRVSHRHLG